MSEKKFDQYLSELRSAFERMPAVSGGKTQPLRLALFDRLDSTMSAARELPQSTPLIQAVLPAWPEVNAEKGLTVALALEQTAGRGRFDRRWVSPRGSGIYLTAAFETTAAISRLPSLSLVCGVAVSEAANSLGTAAKLKWPNDLLVKTPAGYKKLAGLLLETAAAHNAAIVLAGIGLNLLPALPAQAAGGISLAETSATEIGYSQAVLALVQSLALEFGQFFEAGPAGHLKRWRESSLTIGSEVSFIYGQKERRGVARDIDENGALVVESEGDILRLVSGEVSIINAACI